MKKGDTGTVEKAGKQDGILRAKSCVHVPFNSLSNEWYLNVVECRKNLTSHTILYGQGMSVKFNVLVAYQKLLGLIQVQILHVHSTAISMLGMNRDGYRDEIVSMSA